MKTDLLYELLANLRELLDPVVAAARSEERRHTLFHEIGWHIETMPDFPFADVVARLEDVTTALPTLTDAIEDPPDSLDEYLALLAATSRAYESLRELSTLGAGLDPSIPFDRLAADLIEHLTIEHLRERHPLVHDLAVLFTIIEPGEEVIETVGNFVVDPPEFRSRLHLDRLPAVFRDPALLRSAYHLSGPLDAAAQAKQVTDKLFPRIGQLLTNFGWSYVYGIKPMYGLDFGETGNALGSGMLTLRRRSDLEATYGATLALSSRDRGGLGLMITPFGLVTSTHSLGRWQMNLETQLAVDGFAIGPSGLTLPDGPDNASVGARLALIHGPEDGDSGLVFGIGSARLELGQLSIEGAANFSGNERDFGLLFRADKGAVVVSAPEGDGFLQSVLGDRELRAEFEFGLGWSNRRGLYLEGGAGLEHRFPVRRSIGPVRLDAVNVGIQADNDALRAEAGLSFTVRLGPMTATVEGLGVRATLDVGEQAGNLGVADLAFGFSPPAGLTLTVDSGMLTGGGFLHYDADRGEYTGLVSLKHGNLVLTALGILSTRRPDGRPGFSLILLITGEFPPVQLGLGFTLNGAGGLLAVNRTANILALQEGARAGALDAVLFPERPQGNVPQILSDLQTFFPFGDGTHLFGPMVKIGWGPVPILAADVGIALEFPDPLRLLIFGQLHLGLPSLQKPLLDAHLELFGAIDFEAGTVAIDASLVDSTVAGYRIDGDAALRANWKGDDPSFALAIGGFHPGAGPPVGFPALRRVSINLTKTDNPRVRLYGYFALTSNTVQCGARVEAFAKKSEFSVEAFLSFDTLFQFEPFRFVVEMAAGAVVKAFNRTVTTVDLCLTLSGPRPWHAAGRASFRVIWRYTVSFDLTVGDQPDASAVAPVDLRAMLLDELRRPSSWSGQLPPRSGSAVALRDTRLDTTTDILIHPQGRFGVRQSVLPLGVALDKYGEKPPKDDAHFRIRQVSVGEKPIEHLTVQDRYAPAQYFELTDAARLTAPAYQLFDSGVTVTPDAATAGDRVSVRPQYEEVIIDAARGQREVTGVRTVPTPGAMARVHTRAAVATALRRQRDTIAFPGPKHRVRLAPAA